MGIVVETIPVTIKMEEEDVRFIIGTAETTGPPPFEQSQIQQAEQRLKKTLEKIKSKPFLGGEPATLAGRARSIPGFVHLNPELLGAAFYFRLLTKKKSLDAISNDGRNKNMKKALYEIFPSVKKDLRKYVGLKADLIRYLKLIELYF